MFYEIVWSNRFIWFVRCQGAIFTNFVQERDGHIREKIKNMDAKEKRIKED